jgi:GNAT superfamily N-acetyltransferase
VETVVRPYQPEDLGQVLALWERTGCVPVGPDGLSVDQVIDLMNSGTTVTLLGEVDGVLEGMAVGTVAGALGRVERLVVASEPSSQVVAARLLDQLEARLIDRGARKLAALVRADGPIRQHFERCGYEESSGMAISGAAGAGPAPVICRPR